MSTTVNLSLDNDISLTLDLAGATGAGIATGGTAGQFLKKKSSADYDTEFANIAEADVTGLTADLAGKQATLGFTPESIANKSTDGTFAANSDTYYPTQKAAKTYADTKVPTSYLDTDGALAANSDTKIPSQKAVKTYVDTKDAQNVKLTGTQTVAGAKTMSDVFTVSNVMNVDNGSGKAQFTGYLGGFLQLFKGSSDVQPALQLYAGDQSLKFGPGGSTTFDTIIKRTGTNQLDFGSAKLQAVADPATAQDVATKKYVDDNSGTASPSLVNLGGMVGVADNAQVNGQSYWTGGVIPAISSIVGNGTTVTLTFSGAHSIPSGKTALIGITGCDVSAWNKLWTMTYSSSTAVTFSDTTSATASTKGTAYYAGATFYHVHQVIDSVNSIRLVYANWAEGQESVMMTNPITIKASIYTDSTVVPVTFNGGQDRTVTIQPNGTILSDPIGTPALTSSSSTFTSMTYVTQPNGKSTAMWPAAIFPWRTGEAVAQGYDSTDDTFSVPPFADKNGYTYAPIVVAGTRANKKAACVAIVGDSILSGTDDRDDAGTYKALRGYAQRACQANGYSWVKIASSGDLGINFATTALSYRRRPLIDGCTHAIVGYGTNDLLFGNSVANTEAALAKIYANLRAMGIKTIYASLIMPRNSSTDHYATTTNQTHTTNWTNIQTVNAWIQSQVGVSIDGVLDTVSVVCSNSTDGWWKANGTANYATSDGLHPSQYMHTQLASLVPSDWTA